jgi:hypothetical protein
MVRFVSVSQVGFPEMFVAYWMVSGLPGSAEILICGFPVVPWNDSDMFGEFCPCNRKVATISTKMIEKEQRLCQE